MIGAERGRGQGFQSQEGVSWGRDVEQRRVSQWQQVAAGDWAWGLVARPQGRPALVLGGLHAV